MDQWIGYNLTEGLDYTMPRTKSPERETERREQLVQASYAVFAEKGFDAVRLEDIAGAAGFSKAVVHYYFDKKEEFLVEVFQWITGTILERLTACDPGRPRSAGALALATGRTVCLAPAEPAFLSRLSGFFNPERP